MERLTEFWQNKYIADIYDDEKDDGGLGHSIPIDSTKVDKIIQKLGEYENLEEKGLLLKLPCKDGTKVYEIVEECNALSCTKKNCKKCNYYNPHITPTILSLSEIILKIDEFDKTIFFTEEKAKQKLKELM